MVEKHDFCAIQQKIPQISDFAKKTGFEPPTPWQKMLIFAKTPILKYFLQKTPIFAKMPIFAKTSIFAKNADFRKNADFCKKSKLFAKTPIYKYFLQNC
jgi:hypothetical protein